MSHLSDLREALQEHLPNDDDDLGVLTGYVVVAQWSAADGQHLTSTAGDINDEGPYTWTIKGWLAHALHGVDLHPEEEDDES